MPANRIAVVGTILAALGAFLTALLGAFDSETAKAIVASTALVIVGAVVIVYLLGWQKYEAQTVADDTELINVPVPETATTPDPVP